MNESCHSEQQLIAAADGIELLAEDLVAVKARLHAWLSELTRALSAHQIDVPEAMRPAHALAQLAIKLNVLLTTSAQGWERQWEDLEPARALARAFEDRVMLLVFGKFNAGKSSLCNFLADRFAAHGRPVRYFHVESGQVVETAEPLREGAVETTARLQGVCLGTNLVLLDTPGLHSVTPENASLTQRFTDSADAVLWLTSSTSPGQVQELDELARELHRGKPLLPVITRSDLIEEEEIDGEIVKLLRNKSLANRLLQEADVQERGRAKLLQMEVETSLLKPPVSVSVHTARALDEPAQALGDSGYARLCAAILDIVDPARAYKKRKEAEVILHHLEENVLGTIESDIRSVLSQLGSMTLHERLRLQGLQPLLVRNVLRRVLPELPDMLERREPSNTLAELCDEIAKVLRGALLYELQEHIGDHGAHPVEGRDGLQLVMPQDMTYEQLHGVLEERVHQLATRQVDDVLAQCSGGLDALEVSIQTLLDLLVGQQDRLTHIKRHVRDDSKPAELADGS